MDKKLRRNFFYAAMLFCVVLAVLAHWNGDAAGAWWSWVALFIVGAVYVLLEDQP